MRSHLDYAAKQAYDLAVDQHDFNLVEVCQYMKCQVQGNGKVDHGRIACVQDEQY